MHRRTFARNGKIRVTCVRPKREAAPEGVLQRLQGGGGPRPFLGGYLWGPYGASRWGPFDRPLRPRPAKSLPIPSSSFGTVPLATPILPWIGSLSRPACPTA